MTKKKIIGAALAAGAATMAPAHAADGPAGASAVPGWNELIAKLSDLPDRLLARLPEPLRNDPQVRQEAARVALEALGAQALSTVGADGDHPQFLPVIGQVWNTGQPNADTVYRAAKLTPGGTYRLRGRAGSMRMAVIAESGPRPPQPPGQTMPVVGPPRPVHDLNTLKVDAQGNFDVVLSPTRPAGWKGDWWESVPSTNNLLMRFVGSNWGVEREPTVSIERLDVPPQRPRPSAAVLEANLRALPQAVEFSTLMFGDHVDALRRDGFVNKLKIFDLSQSGGLKGQFYYEGVYDLADDEALIVEAKAPTQCLYRSLILTNELYETTDWYNNHSSLNDAQAPVDKDGMLRIVVSAKDPGVPNWLDTAGYPQGIVQGRWTECNAQPIPEVKKVKLADVRKNLPPETGTVTPQQREQIIRERRAQLLQRAMW
ncbi:MAG: hypothetical protein QM676_09960 [Novosphingobium sp.]